MQVLEEVVQNRGGAGDARNVLHGRAIEVADPDADRELGRVAESPIVPEVGAGAGLAGDGKVEAERGLGAEGECARRVVAQDVGDEISGGWVGDLAAAVAGRDPRRGSAVIARRLARRPSEQRVPRSRSR